MDSGPTLQPMGRRGAQGVHRDAYKQFLFAQVAVLFNS